jgi:DNA-binding transcriptional regulator YhcF (GntR family)
MSEKMMSFELNEEMVKPILEKQIQTAILANIGNPEELISKVVSLALKQKVNVNGAKSNYDYENKYDYLDVITGKAIREAAQTGLTEWLSENTQLVKAKVIEEMNKPERRDSLVKSFADAVENALGCHWNFSCNIDFKKQD